MKPVPTSAADPENAATMKPPIGVVEVAESDHVCDAPGVYAVTVLPDASFN